MSLSLTIARTNGSDTQVLCYIDGVQIREFFSFGESYSDADIDTYVRNNLAAKGYSF